jgi:hydrogenase expression/formation protein HypE
MRDATRGGAGSVLHEWAFACGHTLSIESSTLPLSPDVRGMCELLGLDPLFLANEGMMLVAVPAGYSQSALTALHEREPYRSACRIGEVISRRVSTVLVRSTLGQERPLDAPTGQALPRIC